MQNNIYIIKVHNSNKSMIKLGYSSDIKNRLKKYYYHNPLVEVVGEYYRPDAELFERLLHSLFKSEVLHEWYDDSVLDEFIYMIRHYPIVSELKSMNKNPKQTISASSKYLEVADRLNNVITGTFVSSKDLKAILKRIYLEFGITDAPKATDINNYFEVKESVKTIKGKSVKGFLILKKVVKFI